MTRALGIGAALFAVVEPEVFKYFLAVTLADGSTVEVMADPLGDRPLARVPENSQLSHTIFITSSNGFLIMRAR